MEALRSIAQGTILVVEDDPLQVELFAVALPQYRLIPVTTIHEAKAILRRHSPDVILLDHLLGEGERGADSVGGLKQIAPQVPVIIVTGTLGLRDQLSALQGGLSADFVLEKPVDIDQLTHVVERARCECGLSAAIHLLQSVEAASTRDEDEPNSRYVDRLRRLQRVQERLRSVEERPNISGLAREFRVSRRTIIRDIRDLIQLGHFDAGMYPNWHRPWIHSAAVSAPAPRPTGGSSAGLPNGLRPEVSPAAPDRCEPGAPRDRDLRNSPGKF